MPSITIELSLSELNTLTSILEREHLNICQNALTAYPDEKYKKLVQDSAVIGQAQVYNANILAIKTVEVGLTIIDNKIQYLEQRCQHLMQFYVKAQPEDLELLKSRIDNINKEILDQQRNRVDLMNKKIPIEIAEEIYPIVVAFSSQ